VRWKELITVEGLSKTFVWKELGKAVVSVFFISSNPQSAWKTTIKEKNYEHNFIKSGTLSDEKNN
jgi:hypothetical protein